MSRALLIVLFSLFAFTSVASATVPFGPLIPIDAKPDLKLTLNKNSTGRFTVDLNKLKPGRYRVICRVNDTTMPRGERSPWVIKDDHGLLQSERGWWIDVPEKSK